MIFLKIILCFILIYTCTFLLALLIKNSYIAFYKVKQRFEDIDKGIVVKNKPKKEVNKVWNSSLGVWEIK